MWAASCPAVIADAPGKSSPRGATPTAARAKRTAAAKTTPRAETLSWPTGEAATSQAAAPPVGKLSVTPRDEYMAAFVDVQAPDFGIAPLGDDLQDTPAQVAAPALDLSQFSLAPAGSDMGQTKAEPAAPAPDTSHLKLQ